MKLTIEQQAALGRMGYTIRSITNGLRSHNEEFDLVLRAMMAEVINLCLTKHHGRSLTSGQAEFFSLADDLWEFIAMNNPQLLEQEKKEPREGGN